MSIERRLDRINDRANKEVEDLAKMWRNSVLIPLCKKHRLRYTTGLNGYQEGTCVLFRSSYMILTKSDAVTRGEPVEICELFDVLMRPVLGRSNDMFGFHVANVTEEDIAAPSREQTKNRTRRRKP